MIVTSISLARNAYSESNGKKLSDTAVSLAGKRATGDEVPHFILSQIAIAAVITNLSRKHFFSEMCTSHDRLWCNTGILTANVTWR